MRSEPVLVAMSGGVDSSVAAALLARRRFDVVGVTLQIWQESQTDPRHSGCCSLGAVEDARRVARILGIPHYVINFREEFRRSVIDSFAAEYANGRTPNPCVACNRHIKFDLLLTKMRELGCGSLATGHYARIRRNQTTGRLHVLQARAGDKDQSYVLYMLEQAQLARLRFPLGELPSKASTRAIAESLGLPVANKPDSQEICFVSEAGGYRQFLRRLRPDSMIQGEIVDREGNVLGSHDGIANFTVGQRKGIMTATHRDRPLYVLKLEPDSRRVVVGDQDGLLQREVRLCEPTWGSVAPDGCPVRVNAKVRYNMVPQPATLHALPTPRIEFDRPVRAITPGQIAVAYRGRSVAAGGTIAGP